MYDVSLMKSELLNAIAVTERRVRAQFSEAFVSIYADSVVPDRFPSGCPPIDRLVLARAADLREVYSGAGFYVILTDRAVDGNACRLGSGALRAIYRGECGTVRRRIQSHLFNSLYNSDYDQRSSRYSSDPKNVGRSFYEPHWPHCLKLDPGGPSGINIDQAPHSNFSWLVLVHRMSGSSQRVRQLAELAFDDAFGHPSASRDA